MGKEKEERKKQLFKKNLGGCAAATASQHRVKGYHINTQPADGSTHREPIRGGENGMRAHSFCY
jgi:hypothetical protein